MGAARRRWSPGWSLPVLRRHLPAVACGCLLFAVFSWQRTHLIPSDAEFARAQWLLTGDEPAYLLLAQAIASGDGLNVRPAHERGSYRDFQSRAVIGSDQWTWEAYRALGFKPWLDRGKAWGDSQILPRLPLFPPSWRRWLRTLASRGGSSDSFKPSSQRERPR